MDRIQAYIKLLSGGRVAHPNYEGSWVHRGFANESYAPIITYESPNGMGFSTDRYLPEPNGYYIPHSLKVGDIVIWKSSIPYSIMRISELLKDENVETYLVDYCAYSQEDDCDIVWEHAAAITELSTVVGHSDLSYEEFYGTNDKPKRW